MSKLLPSTIQTFRHLMSLRREEVVLRRDGLVGDGGGEVEAGGRRPQPLHRTMAEVVELQGRRRLRRRGRVGLHHCAGEKKRKLMASLMILST